MSRERHLLAILSGIAGIGLLLTLSVLLFGQRAFSAYGVNRALWSNLALMPFALAGLALTALARPRAARLKRRGNLPLIVWAVTLLGVQLVFVRGTWFYPGWDIEDVYVTAEALARGLPVDGTYFRLCPNNAPLTVLLSLPLRLAAALGLAVPYAILPYLSACLVTLSCVLCVLCVRALTPSRLASVTAAALCTLLCAITLHSGIPYTDTFSIVFPISALYLYLHVRRPYLKWFLISLCCFIGASIKATCLIFLAALVIVSVLRMLAGGGLTKKRLLSAALALALIVLGAVPGRAWQSWSTALLAGSAVPEEQLSVTHYLMLGMNDETMGGHSPDDVTFTSGFATLRERKEANLRRAWERFSARGLTGNLRFFAIKAYKAFNSGTFAANGSYLMIEDVRRTDALSRLFRSVFYADGKLNGLYTTLMQALWLMTLCLCAMALLGRSRPITVTALLGLCLMGVGAYQLLFEVWPRYLYIFSPLFIALAALGTAGLRLNSPPAKASIQ